MKKNFNKKKKRLIEENEKLIDPEVIEFERLKARVLLEEEGYLLMLYIFFLINFIIYLELLSNIENMFKTDSI